MVLKITSTPSRFNFSVKYREFVSWRKGVSSSEPIATISAFTAKSVNETSRQSSIASPAKTDKPTTEDGRTAES